MLANLLTALRKRLKNRKVRFLFMAFLGSAIGLSCAFLPEAFQGTCHLAARLIGLIVGGL